MLLVSKVCFTCFHSHKEVSAEWTDGVEGGAEVGLLPAGPMPAGGVLVAALPPSCLLQALLYFGEISGLCLSEWSVLSTRRWVCHLTRPPVSFRGPLPTSGIFKVLCPAEVPCAPEPGTWTPRCMGCDEQCRFVPHQGMVVERLRLTGSGSERQPPPPQPILFPSRPVLLGPSFLHVLHRHSQLALDVEFTYLLILYSLLQFSLSLSENNELVIFLSKTPKTWF